MKYQVILKAPRDMVEADYRNGANTLCEEINGYKYGIWFDSIDEAKEACIQHNGFGIIDDEELEYVWNNPEYKSESSTRMRQHLGKILLPHIGK